MVVQKAALKAEMTAEKRAVNAEKIKIEVINLIVHVNMVRIVDVIESHQKEKLLGVIQDLPGQWVVTTVSIIVIFS